MREKKRKKKKHFWGCAPISWVQTFPCTFCQKLVKLSRAKRTWDAFFFSFARMLSFYFKFYEYIFFPSQNQNWKKLSVVTVLWKPCISKTQNGANQKENSWLFIAQQTQARVIQISKLTGWSSLIQDRPPTMQYPHFRKQIQRKKKKKCKALRKTRGRKTFKQKFFKRSSINMCIHRHKNSTSESQF